MTAASLFGNPPPAGAAAARGAARKILSGPDFNAHGAKTPRPLAGVLHDLGQWLHDIVSPAGRPLGAAFDRLAGLFGRAGAIALVCVVIAVVVFALARILVVRSARLGKRGGTASAALQGDDPSELDRMADRAEASGDLELAVRLRYRAGLLRLERRGRIAERDTHTSREISAILGSPSFSRLSADLEAIVYAERPAVAAQAEAARALWPKVYEESSPK